MERVRVGLGFFVAVLLALSSVAHSVLGWSAVSAELAKVAMPADLALGLGIAWRLGGAAMVVFAAVVAHTFVRRARGQAVSLVPSGIIGVGYTLYGAWAFVAGGFEPFYFVLFVVPGLLLTFASGGGRPG